jgi:hypothetical protein
VEERIVRLLEQRGPQTGAELREALGSDGFTQWKACMLSERVSVRRVGRRYLRLDQRVEGYARLSPSILREFLTYSIAGLATEPEALQARTEELAAHIVAISEGKRKLVERIVSETGARLPARAQSEGEELYCALVAGDIVYRMGHDAGRPEHSTGHMVRGSDLDLVFITRDDAPQDLVKQLDDAVYQEKHRRLNNPAFREEIDYTIKPLARVREQVAFDTFKHMVPCKILDEAVFVYGCRALYEAAREMLAEQGIPGKLAALEATATEARERAEEQLLSRDEGDLAGDDLYLFHTSEEAEEFD